MLVSATIGPQVMQIAGQLAEDWADLRIEEDTLDLSKLHQFFEIVSEHNKFKLL